MLVSSPVSISRIPSDTMSANTQFLNPAGRSLVLYSCFIVVLFACQCSWGTVDIYQLAGVERRTSHLNFYEYRDNLSYSFGALKPKYVTTNDSDSPGPP